MTDRSLLASRFLAQTAWKSAARAPLAGDASNRRYERLQDAATGQTAVLMDAPPEKGEDIRPFVRISRHLRSAGLSAPEILAQDEANGFLLLEDLGDDLYAQVVRSKPGLESQLYTQATEALITLHQAECPMLEPYDPPIMTELAALALTRYRDGITGTADPVLQQSFTDRFSALLEQFTACDPVLVQRDYHADNLLWLPEREGVAQVGLLDFQDARAGHPAYDLVSLLQDARRDVPRATEQTMLQHYIRRTGSDPQAFENAYHVLGVQRNLRILGVFARLSLDYGKPHYVDFIPRVWGYLQHSLQQPALASVAEFLNTALPEPTPENLAKLRP
jgi:aminoglycoside/choline kinase family phosphotransferase